MEFNTEGTCQIGYVIIVILSWDGREVYSLPVRNSGLSGVFCDHALLVIMAGIP